MRWLFLILPALCSSLLFAQHTLQIQVVNVRPGEGPIRMALFDSENAFQSSNDENLFVGQVVTVEQQTEVEYTWSGIPHGRYALAIYQDLNNNGLLDKNALGIPQEPYGFTNNPKAKWRKPKFSEVVFSVRSNPTNLRLVLKSWQEQ